MPFRAVRFHVGLVVVTAAVAGLLVLPWASRTSGWVGPGRVAVEAGVALGGRTTIEVPPLGRVSARTPGAPLHLRASIEELDLEKTQALATTADPEAALSEASRRDLAGLLRKFVLRTLALSIVIGALAGALLPGRRWWYLAVGAGASLVVVTFTLALGWQRFDTGAFEQPRFEGALERAPSIIEAARRHVDELEGVRNRVRTLGNQLADLYAASSAVDVGTRGSGGTRILHVSDLHLNPLGLELVGRIVRSFDVDAVLDTGDLTSFGYPIEAEIAERVARVPVRYLFVPGNHDSMANRAAIDAFPNVELLDGTIATVDRVRILGIADPTFTATNETTTEEAKEFKEDTAGAVATKVRRLGPDVLAVHDRLHAQESGGAVPLVVAGHSHRRMERQDRGTRFLTVGSAGAGGIGSFMVEKESAYEAQILHFRGRTLVAIDYVTVRGVSGDLKIEREVLDESDDEESSG